MDVERGPELPDDLLLDAVHFLGHERPLGVAVAEADGQADLAVRDGLAGEAVAGARSPRAAAGSAGPGPGRPRRRRCRGRRGTTGRATTPGSFGTGAYWNGRGVFSNSAARSISAA
ncbi:MAG: hypothetical protein MZU79_04760 [Anaerotruncus sp.]|nr:hypothetical protein [Anaerotruncus sp.]